MDHVFEGFDTTDDPADGAGPGLGVAGEQQLPPRFLPDVEHDELVRDVLTRGVDLQQHTRQIDQELRELEDAQLASYEEHEGALVELDAEIHGCGAVLENMEQLLTSFKTSLG
ncbi:Vacuolar protein sorting-associated protein 52, partial [Coemansia nantahalensis]